MVEKHLAVNVAADERDVAGELGAKAQHLVSHCDGGDTNS